MKSSLRFTCILFLFTLGQEISIAQKSGTDQATLLLDLRSAQARYETAREQHENDKRLFEQNAISKNDYDASRNQMLTAQVEYQKLILRVISEQSYIVIERAIKYQTPSRRRRVRVILRSTASGNEEYLDYFRRNPDIFTTEMRPDKVYNIFVSLLNLTDQTIIGDPYEAHIPSIALGGRAEADFTLLRDVESLQILLNYGDRSETRNVFLQQDASADIVDVSSLQFSQETDLGSKAIYDLTLERFSSGDDVYKLEVLNLPRQVTYEFLDSSTQARLFQVKFNQGETSKRLSLVVYMPDRSDEQIVIGQPISFYALAVNQNEAERLTTLKGQPVTDKEIEALNTGKVHLELIPRGVGRIETVVPTLYFEIRTGDRISTKITVKNTGTRRLDNVRISTDNPLHWRSEIDPQVIPSLEAQQETTVNLLIVPQEDAGIGAQEVRIKTEAISDNRAVQTEDKNIRIQISARTPLLGTFFLVFLLLGLVVGIVIFGIRLSRR